MKLLLLFCILFSFNLVSCSTVRESAGVNRKSIDEYEVVENPPLVIPPDFNLLPPEQLQEKNIENIETDLAKEILFGLDENELNPQKETSTVNQILSKAEALDVSPSIRKEIDEDFANEIDTESIYQITFEDEIEVLDAIKESERIRNNTYEGQSISEGNIPVKTETIKKKKKKRFIFF